MHELVRQTNAWACYDCGKCTATCPLPRVGASYSPRRHVLASNLGEIESLAGPGTLSACLTCGQCDALCPADVDYTGLVLRLREQTRGEQPEGECPHGGALQSMMRMMARGGTQQDRLAWLDNGLETSPDKARVFFWTGCAMYYDAFFPELDISVLDGTRAAIKLLNASGETPVVSAEERCCGHDLLWNGDRAGFEALARHNVDLVIGSGAEVLVTSCAECLRTWKLDYQPFLPAKPPQILHLSEYLGERLGELPMDSSGQRTVTFQDPCRMGRHLGVYEPPRQMLGAVPGVDLVEMERSHKRGLCCAGGTWSSCDRYAKKIQVDRLREARATGAEVLATACPKCQIHLRCAMNDPNLGEEITIELRDVAELAAEALV